MTLMITIGQFWGYFWLRFLNPICSILMSLHMVHTIWCKMTRKLRSNGRFSERIETSPEMANLCSFCGYVWPFLNSQLYNFVASVILLHIKESHIV